jgi:hypothetical protein
VLSMHAYSVLSKSSIELQPSYMRQGPHTWQRLSSNQSCGMLLLCSVASVV